MKKWATDKIKLDLSFYWIKIANKKICSNIQAFLILGSLEQENVIMSNSNDVQMLLVKRLNEWTKHTLFTLMGFPYSLIMFKIFMAYEKQTV